MLSKNQIITIAFTGFKFQITFASETCPHVVIIDTFGIQVRCIVMTANLCVFNQKSKASVILVYAWKRYSDIYVYRHLRKMLLKTHNLKLPKIGIFTSISQLG